jgi:hypothetical protein
MAKETTLKEIGETLSFIVDGMVTKDDLKSFATKNDVRTIIAELVPGSSHLS